MPKTRPPYAAEFRQQMVDLVRSTRVAWLGQEKRFPPGPRVTGVRSTIYLRQLRRDQLRERDEEQGLSGRPARRVGDRGLTFSGGCHERQPRVSSGPYLVSAIGCALHGWSSGHSR